MSISLLAVSHRGFVVVSERSSLSVDAGIPVSSEMAFMERPDATSASMSAFHMGPDLRLAEDRSQRVTECRPEYCSDMSTPHTFGERVLEMRLLRGMKQADLARASGLSPTTINEIESGLNQTTRKLSQLAKALRANPMYLTDGKLPRDAEDLSLSVDLPDIRAGDISIPQLDVWGSMGHGAVPPDHVDVVRNVIVNRKELEKQCSFTAPQNLQIITGYGRSMQPTFQDGDPLLVDTGVTTVTIDAVYVFEIEGEIYIKGLQRLPGGRLRVISHNRSENDPWEIDPFQMESLKIRGRVVMAWNARRL